MSPHPSTAEKRAREKEALRHRAEHHPPATPEAIAAHGKVRLWVYAFGALLIDTCPASTELAAAVRTLTDEVAAGCHAAIARYPERLPALELNPPDTTGLDLDDLDPLPGVYTPPMPGAAVSTSQPVDQQLVVQWNGTALGTIDLDARVARLGARTEARTDETGTGGDELLIFPPATQAPDGADVLILRKGEWLAVDADRWAVGAAMSDALAKVVVVT